MFTGRQKIVKANGAEPDEFEASVAQELFNLEVTSTTKSKSIFFVLTPNIRWNCGAGSVANNCFILSYLRFIVKGLSQWAKGRSPRLIHLCRKRVRAWWWTQGYHYFCTFPPAKGLPQDPVQTCSWVGEEVQVIMLINLSSLDPKTIQKNSLNFSRRLLLPVVEDTLSSLPSAPSYQRPSTDHWIAPDPAQDLGL